MGSYFLEKKRSFFIIFVFLFFSCSKLGYISLIFVGNYHYIRGNYQSAISIYYNILKNEKYSPWAYYNLGVVYYSLGEYESSLRIFSYAKKSNDFRLNFSINYNEGVIYYNQGLYQKAEASFKEALKIDPDSYNAKYNLELSIMKRHSILEKDMSSFSNLSKNKYFLENNENFLRYVENLEKVVWLKDIKEDIPSLKEDW